MEKKAEQFAVGTTDEGSITISQEHFGNDTPETVYIHPDQVDLLIQWVKEAKDALTNPRVNSAVNGHRQA